MKPWKFLLPVLALAACGPSDQTNKPVPAPAQPTSPVAAAPQAASSPDPALRPYLETRTRDAMPPLSYIARTHGEGLDRLTLVYFNGPEYCGSGGCQLLVLGAQGDPYVVLGDISIVNAPIRILENRTNGRPDIGVQVRGGGVTEAYEAVLQFDGRRYPSNPSTAPSRKVEGAAGAVLISDDNPREVLKE